MSHKMFHISFRVIYAGKAVGEMNLLWMVQLVDHIREPIRAK